MPPAIGALIATIGSFIISHIAVSVLVKALLTIALSLAVTLLSKKPQGNKLNQGQELRTKFDPTMPRQVLVGRTATGGSCHFAYTTSDNYKKPNRYLYRVIQLSDRPISALVEVREGAQTLSWSGDLTTGWRSCTQHRDKHGNAKFWMRVYLGADSATADATLVSETGGLWTTDHKGTGIAYAIIKMDYDEDAFSNGEPELTWVVDGAKCYDDRKDSTKVGGSGAHRLATYSTWEFTNNSAIITAQYLRGFYTNGSIIVGVQAEERDLSTSMLFSAYNTCDQSVTIDAGTEARYESGMIINADEAAADILIDLQASMDGKIFDRGGAITLLPGANRTPVLALTDEDVIWTAEKSWQPRASLEQMLNHVTSNFIDRDQNFQERNLPILSNPTWEADDGGERFTQFFSFRAVNKWTQGQRITKRLHLASRYNGTAAFVGGLWLLELEQGDWITMTSERWGFTAKYFEIQEHSFTANAQIALVCREVHPNIDVWDHSVDEVARDDSSWTPPDYDLPVPDISALGFKVTDAATGLESFGITMQLDDDPALYGALIKYIEFQYTWGDESIIANVNFVPIDIAQTTVTGLAPSTDYKVRARFRDDSRGGDWTAWETVATDVGVGFDAYSAYLTQTNWLPGAEEDGTLLAGALTGSGGSFILLKNGVAATGVTFTVQSEVGIDVSINSTTGVFTLNSMSADTGTAIFRATVGSLTFDQSYNVSKVKAGVSPNFIQGYLSVDYANVIAGKDNVVTSYTNAAGTFKLFDANGVAVTTGFTLSVGANPQGLTVAFAGLDYSVTAGFDAGETEAYVTIVATGSGVWAGYSVSKVLSLGKKYPLLLDSWVNSNEDNSLIPDAPTITTGPTVVQTWDDGTVTIRFDVTTPFSVDPTNKNSIDGLYVIHHWDATSTSYAFNNSDPGHETKEEKFLLPGTTGTPQTFPVLLEHVAPNVYHQIKVFSMRTVNPVIDTSKRKLSTGVTSTPYRPSTTQVITGVIGTGGPTAATVATAVGNYNTDNDQNSTTPTAPTSVAVSTASFNSDGSCDVAVTWSYTNSTTVGDPANIDKFYVGLYPGSGNITYVPATHFASMQWQEVTPDKRGVRFPAVAANRFYTAVVVAQREVARNIASNGLKESAAAQNATAVQPTATPNSTIDVNGTPATNVSTGVVRALATINGSNQLVSNTVLTGSIMANNIDVNGYGSSGSTLVCVEQVGGDIITQNFSGADITIVGNFVEVEAYVPIQLRKTDPVNNTVYTVNIELTLYDVTASADLAGSPVWSLLERWQQATVTGSITKDLTRVIFPMRCRYSGLTAGHTVRPGVKISVSSAQAALSSGTRYVRVREPRAST